MHVKHIPLFLLFSSFTLLTLSAPNPLTVSEIQPRLLSGYVPNSYIVVLKKDITPTLVRRHTYKAEKQFSIGSFQGYLTTFADKDEVAALSLSPEASQHQISHYSGNQDLPLSYGRLTGLNVMATFMQPSCSTQAPLCGTCIEFLTERKPLPL